IVQRRVQFRVGFRGRGPRTETQDQRDRGRIHERAQRSAELPDGSLQTGNALARLTRSIEAVPSPFLPFPISWGEGWGEGFAASLAPDCVKIKQSGMLEQFFVFDGATVHPLAQQ